LGEMKKKGKLIVGADHGGRELLGFLKGVLEKGRCEVVDVTPAGEGSIDYPTVAIEVAKRVSSGEFERGILVCGTGIGMSMVANRFPGVRATLVHDAFSAEMSRRHNDSNLLVLGGRTTGRGVAEQILKIWLKTEFDGAKPNGKRHKNRLNILKKLDRKIKIPPE